MLDTPLPTLSVGQQSLETAYLNLKSINVIACFSGEAKGKDLGKERAKKNSEEYQKKVEKANVKSSPVLDQSTLISMVAGFEELSKIKSEAYPCLGMGAMTGIAA